MKVLPRRVNGRERAHHRQTGDEMSERTCSIEGCNRAHYGRGYCTLHWNRWRRTGDPLMVRPHGAPAGDVAERFWSKVDKDGPIPPYRPELGPCWIWTRARDPKGYGEFGLARRSLRAHRWAWIDANGPVPDGLELDHLCRVPACVRPSHLEAVTSAENIRRGMAGRFNAAKTRCPRGHLYDETNTYRYKGSRQCRECRRTECRERWRRTHGFVT